MTECWRISTRSRVGDVLGVAIGPHVERDDDRVRRRRQQHVRLVHRADAGVNDPDLHLLVGQLGERVGEHFGRALHVGLDDDRQLFHAAFGDLRLQRLERQPRALRAERRDSSPAPRGTSRCAAPWRRRRPGTRRPAAAGPARPSTSTGVDGPADFVGLPRSSISARTRPTIGPAMNVSPTFSVPSCTSTVATGPTSGSSAKLAMGDRRTLLRRLPRQQIAQPIKDWALALTVAESGRLRRAGDRRRSLHRRLARRGVLPWPRRARLHGSCLSAPLRSREPTGHRWRSRHWRSAKARVPCPEVCQPRSRWVGPPGSRFKISTAAGSSLPFPLSDPPWGFLALEAFFESAATKRSLGSGSFSRRRSSARRRCAGQFRTAPPPWSQPLLAKSG